MQSKDQVPKHRNWVFTVQSEVRVDKIARFLRYEYMVVGEFTIPEILHKQWRGYVQFKSQMRESTIRNALQTDDIMHWEPARLSATTNIQFCKRQGNLFFEKGEPRGIKKNQRPSTRAPVIVRPKVLSPVARARDDGAMRRNLRASPRARKTRVIWIYGPPGTGKRAFAWRDAAELRGDIYDVPEQFDGTLCMKQYRGQRNVIWDEFQHTHCRCSDLMNLCGNHEFRVATGARFEQWTSARLYIIAREHPSMVYTEISCEERQLLLDQIDVILSMPELGRVVIEKALQEA